MKKSVSALALAILFSSTGAFAAVFTEGGSNEGGGFPVGGGRPGGERTVTIPPPQFVAPPVLQGTTDRNFPTLPNLPVNVFADPLQAIDVTRDNPNLPKLPTSTNIPVAGGVQTVPIAFFDKHASGDESSEWILVRGDETSNFQKTTPSTVKLIEGTILVSVRRPSRYALIQTPNGPISVGADGDVLVSYENGVVRLDNLSGRGMRILMKIDKNVLGEVQSVAVAPGYELVAGDHKLTRGEVRPADGIGRRGMSLMANGQVAVNEFSVESFLNSSTIVASLVGNTSDVKEHKVLNDMSKMAAVLNYVNGSSGYSSATTGLAAKSGSTPQ